MDTIQIIDGLVEKVVLRDRQIQRLQRRLGRKSWHLRQARTALGQTPSTGSALERREEQARKEAVRIRYDSMRESRDGLAGELADIRKVLADQPVAGTLAEGVAALRDQRDAADREVQALKSIKRDVAEILGCGPEELLTRAARRVRYTLQKKENRVSTLLEELTQARNEVGSLRRTLSGFNEERERLTRERKAVDMELAQLRAEHDQARVSECLELVGKEEPYELFDAVEGLVADRQGDEIKRLQGERNAEGER